MLSKTERKILKGLAKLIVERDIEKVRKETLRSAQKGESTRRIRMLESDIKNYFFKQGISDDYKRVLTHRIKKKANQLTDDIILILQTYRHLNMYLKHFLPSDKCVELICYLPKTIRIHGIDADLFVGVSMRDFAELKKEKEIEEV